MHEFIKSMAGSLSGASSAARAQAIFDQAMAKGSYRWGRKAKLVAGASLAIALREANKSDSLRDIAVSHIVFCQMSHHLDRSFYSCYRTCVDFCSAFFASTSSRSPLPCSQRSSLRRFSCYNSS